MKLNGGADFGFAFGEKARFRVSVMKAKTNYGMVLRQIPYKMFGLRDIGLPDKIRELLYRPGSGPVPRHRADRLGQIDDARVDRELHQRAP